ncbi:PTS N-acetylglucosamine transporter subunit IIBC [Dolosicoccus paucivorans]|uniref:PTS N-acetylglucosamine transporter subunit IIBC n=1 Tax=Dolosicoccus paucivorans TaxID=84521 RepID=A0A2N6SPI7_9LACT|nr:PTS N-acetylglucosamine transporter subunit IIBC [Dolosicoccus paucivorans]PMC58969.1 PTS N-acetylglucosamine transporter subunit IIBC [Dolosicoccus paucivorans]
MKKVIVATHHNLAAGFKDTLEYIAPNTVEVIPVNAYVESEDAESEIKKVLEKVAIDDKPLLVFTDLLGGSVNQIFTKFLSEYNLQIITGTNLPVMLTLALQYANSDLSKEDIHHAVSSAREQIVYVNDFLLQQELDADDE